MAVEIKNSCIIKPAKPTCEGVFPFTDWDQTGMITHIPTVYFYKPSEDWIASSKSIMNTLKESLSHVLVHFYPLAGRVKWIGKGRLELVCNSMGVELIEAESNGKLSDLGDFASQTHQFHDLLPFVNYDKFEELPLIIGQVTFFQCGGICLGVTISHLVADGQSALHFMREWARLARGETLQEAPYINHNILRAQGMKKVQNPYDRHSELRSPPLIIGKENNREERLKPTGVKILPLDKDQVKTLKSQANREPNNHKDRPYSRYEVVAAHVWRTSCKARKHLDNQPTCLGFSIDVRSRLHPPLPPKFFGNAILDVVAPTNAGDVTGQPLSDTCAKIREALDKVDDDYVWSNIEFFYNQPDLTPFQDLHGRMLNNGVDGPYYGNPNIGVISWLTLPIYGLDFGWGKEVYMGPGTHDYDGDCLILPGSTNDGSVKVALCLQLAHMDAFKKHFYEDVCL
ncbi:spermidine hydroxycinnamoyl transferase-like [Silene latifolia]|uniref:spermidine hydroxycinnamoyl transferase-like n=1 Tax=Silene latifolia TaxID=37657 RepID=UPI003D7719A3